MNDSQELSPEQLQLVIDAADLAVWDWQVQSGKMYFNKRWAEMLGYTIEELLPLTYETWEQLVHPNDYKKAIRALDLHFGDQSKRYEVEFRMKRKDGTYHWILSIGKSIEFDDLGQTTRMIGVHIDNNFRRQSEQELDTKTKLLEESQKIAKVGGWELDIDSGDLFWTDETYRIHDTSPDDFFPTVDAGVSYFLPESKIAIIDALNAAINEGVGYDLELETYTTKGRKIDVRTNCVVSFNDGKAVKLSGTFQDISEQKAIQRNLEKSNRDLALLNEKLKQNAHYDTLTGLPNRVLLDDRMQQSISRSLRNETLLAVMFVDLDGFKEINDKYGHSVGDELMILTANKMKSKLRATDTIARYGGDEFVILIDDLSCEEDCRDTTNRILHSIAEKSTIQQEEIQVTASIGFTLFPHDNSSCPQLLRHADRAMYIAKNAGKNRIHFFDITKDTESRFKMEELEAIRAALGREEFVLHYQPKINLRTNEIIGVEALIRWQHPEEGLLAPIKFLPTIEGDPLSIELGEWVIEQALQQIVSWSKDNIRLPVSVNIDSHQLQADNFVEKLKSILKKYPEVEPRYLELEVVETSAVNQIEHAEKVMHACLSFGVDFSIDDFGTGYSSLTYLKRLPTNKLKIDRYFVIDMLDDEDDRAIVEGIIKLANTFNQQVIAEGVESIQHGKALLELGCELAQGFGIAKPMAANLFEKWIQDWQTDNTWKQLQP